MPPILSSCPTDISLVASLSYREGPLAAGSGAISLKFKAPEVFDRRGDCITGHTCLYNVEQYLNLSLIASGNTVLTGKNKILFASSFLKSSAAVGWFNSVIETTLSITREAFKPVLLQKCVLVDQIKRFRDRLRKFKRTSSVWKYLSEFGNLSLPISSTHDEEKVNHCIEELKYGISVQVLKSHADAFDKCARIALTVDSAVWRAGSAARWENGSSPPDKTPTPSEVRNMESGQWPNSLAQRKRKKGFVKACMLRL